MHSLEIRGTWDGGALRPGEFARWTLRPAPGHLHLRLEASYHGDPAPQAPPGRLWGLWEHEVVELFLLGPQDHYLELELGPHGHHLALWLEGRRQVARDRLPVECECKLQGARWSAELRLERSLLPPGPLRWNAYAIHGVGARRRYLAAHPAPGPAPDFHRLEAFAPAPEELWR